jgi:hypothetical protein
MLLLSQVHGVLTHRPMSHVLGHSPSIRPGIVCCADIADLRGSPQLPILPRHR